MTFAPAIGQQTLPQQTATSAQSAGNRSFPAGIPQGTGQGLSIVLDYNSTLRYDDNLGLDNPSLGSTTRWENTLGLGIVSQTPGSQLAFDLTGLHRYADQPRFGSSAEFTDPSAKLVYSRSQANSQFTIRGEYTERDLNFNQSLKDLNLDGVIDAADLTIDRGTRVSSRAGLAWQTGINDPLGFIFSYDVSEQTFNNTTDPALFDVLRQNYSLTALLRLSPVAVGNVTLSYQDYTAQDTRRTDRQTTTLSTGVTYDISPVTTIDANVGITQVDETLKAIPLVNNDESYVASVSWTKNLANGTANARANRTFGTNGERTIIQAGRTYILQSGTFGFNAGITRGPFGENTPIGDLSYTHTLSTSQITATLRRRVGTSNQNVETRETRASLDYDYFINSLSNLSFGVSYAEQKRSGVGPSNDRQRADLSASYTRALTKDWDLTLGYQHRFKDDSGSGTAHGNSVFLTLGRQFTLKP